MCLVTGTLLVSPYQVPPTISYELGRFKVIPKCEVTFRKNSVPTHYKHYVSFDSKEPPLDYERWGAEIPVELPSVENTCDKPLVFKSVVSGENISECLVFSSDVTTLNISTDCLARKSTASS